MSTMTLATAVASVPAPCVNARAVFSLTAPAPWGSDECVRTGACAPPAATPAGTTDTGVGQRQEELINRAEAVAEFNEIMDLRRACMAEGRCPRCEAVVGACPLLRAASAYAPGGR
jgi:hypothetical protein